MKGKEINYWQWTFKNPIFYIILFFWTLFTDSFKMFISGETFFSEVIGNIVMEVLFLMFVFFLVYIIYKKGYKDASRKK